MRPIIILLLLAFSSFAFAQNTGLIVGKVMDNELDNAPLVFANVSIKNASIASQTDFTGLFVIENLEHGDYTLVCSFAGYETQEIKVKVSSDTPTNVNLSLDALALPAFDLASNDQNLPEATK